MRLRNCVFAAMLMGCAFAGFSQAADTTGTGPATRSEPAASRPAAYLDEASAGPDFSMQGEYEGMIGEAKVGVQIIALGNRQFDGVFYVGGLPGAGWNGTDKRELDSSRTIVPGYDSDSGSCDLNLDKITFTVQGGYSMEFAGDNLVGKTSSGEAFELKKVLRQSPTLGAKAPEGAVVLFDGTNVDAWNGRMNANKLLVAGATSKQQFKDCTIHLEFCLPFMPDAREQARGNSGVMLQGRYEIQILDSFGLAGERNECGAVYTISKPLVNMCFPPLSWQTYDIEFVAPKYDASGAKTADAQVTLRHNGVLVQDKVSVPRRTAGRTTDLSLPGPLSLQDHGNPVVFRNIWIVPK